MLAQPVRPASLTAVFGAADALSQAAVTTALPADQAKEELSALIVMVIGRD